jgi:enoyl-CoA hydratase/carnithine racemase
LISTGRAFDAAEAARLDRINRVVPAAGLLDEALALANLLATKPPLRSSQCLTQFIAGWMRQSTMGSRSRKPPSPGSLTYDARERVTAFVEKRHLTFIGR